MKSSPRNCVMGTALVVFVILPLVVFAMGEIPRRSYLKETLSVLTLLAFSLMLGQFFLARSTLSVQGMFGPRRIQWLHRLTAYGATTLLLIHPVLIVLPRSFEAGVKPLDALITMLTTFDTLGIVLGLVAWVLMVLLGATAIFRMRLIRRYRIRYRHWRYFHGALATGFAGIALWHAIELGRHTDAAMSTLFVVIAVVGFAQLARTYLSEARASTRQPRGAKA